MEATLFRGSSDQTTSPYKSQIRNPRKIHHPFISSPSGNFSPPNSLSIGLLQTPPPWYALQQPPLLPLPAVNRRRSSAGRGPANKKPNTGTNNRTRDPSLTPQKSKSPKKVVEKSSASDIGSSITDPSGPDPTELPKHKPFVSSSGNIRDNANYVVDTNSLGSGEDQADLFSGSAAFTISPPPSSLPLPTFSLRSKFTSCRAEAAIGVDAGATDDLRRLLRLR